MMLKALKRFAGIASKSSLVAAGMLCCASAYALDADAEGMLYNGDSFVLHLNDYTEFDAGMSGNYDTVSYTRGDINHFGTLCLPFAYDTTMIKGNVRLYELGYVRDTVIKLVEIESVAAGRPVLFYSYNPSEGIYITTDIEKNGGEQISVVGEPIADQFLTGSFTTETVTKEANLKFFMKDDKFMRGNESFVVTCFRAFIHKQNVNNTLKSLSFLFDLDEEDATVSQDFKKPEVKLVGIYNMKGQQVKEMQKNEMYILRMSDGSSRKVMVE